MMEVDGLSGEEEYVLARARTALKTDNFSGKAWMLTAKTLYPQNFSVQFEAYKYEKVTKNVKEAARCFTGLVCKFQEQPEFWKEINSVAQALRMEGELDEESQFLCDMFKHISTEVQHKLLLITADHCEDTQEHCKLLLLLLQKFPSSISSHGAGLIETLLSAEKHNLAGNTPVNQYRKLLLSELIPLLNSDGNKLNLTPKILYKLFHKAIEYHLYLLWGNICNKKEDAATKAQESWENLYEVFKFVVHQFGWDPIMLSFSLNWCKDSYWQKLLQMLHSPNFKPDDQNQTKQLTYSLALFLLYNLYHYLYCLNSESVAKSACPSYLLVQGFVDPHLPSYITDNPAKRRKSCEVSSANAEKPVITTENHKNIKTIIPSFTMAVYCWDLIHSSDQLKREFIKLSGALNFEPWLSTFLVDYLTYKDKHEDVLRRLENDAHFPQVPKLILKAEVYFLQRNYIASYDNICEALQLLPEKLGETCQQLVIGGNQRHLHFLPLTRITIIQYLSKFILQAIRQNGFKKDTSVGHCFVLMQVDWPNEEDFLPILIQEICKTRTFYYLYFQTYIVEIDILEELAFLWNSQNGQITFEILPNLQVRRIGTRGADKGMREEIKYTIKRQIDKANTPLHELVLQFLLQERTDIAHSLI